jgi:hypothetical protein
MNILVTALSVLKLGLYTPMGGPLPVIPYVGADLVASKEYRPGLEVGITVEPVKRSIEWKVNGQYGTRYAYEGAGLLGLSWRYHNDLTFSAGVKYRIPDSNIGGYAGVAFRLGSARLK